MHSGNQGISRSADQGMNHRSITTNIDAGLTSGGNTAGLLRNYAGGVYLTVMALFKIEMP